MRSAIETILKFLNDYANLILVISTIIYSFLTFRTVGLMKRQIISHIRVSKAIVKSSLLSCRGRNCKDILLKEIVDKKIASFKNELFAFRVSVDFYNSSSGSGSIDQPKLVLRFRKSRFSLELKNHNEESGFRETIFMSGGDLQKKDFDYFLPYNREFLKNLQRHPGRLEYLIKYKDNSNKVHLVYAGRVEPLK